MRNYTRIIKDRTTILKVETDKLTADISDIERRLEELERQGEEDERLANTVSDFFIIIKLTKARTYKVSKKIKMVKKSL